MAGQQYDGIVAGSGITGGLAAKELCERGIKVLLLERGRNAGHVKDRARLLVRASGRRSRGWGLVDLGMHLAPGSALSNDQLSNA